MTSDVNPELDTPEEMTTRIYRLYVVERLTQSEIAAKVGMTQEGVSYHVRKARAMLKPAEPADVRAEALATYEEVERRAWELINMDGAPVTSGKDGDVVTDPETGATVRDYSGRLAALKLALEVSRDRRKLLGIDAAEKVSMEARVSYELVDFSKEDLT